MIVFHACGGLGNQLFQYATARALAFRLGVDLAVDLSWYSSRTHCDTPRVFDLFHLNTAARILNVVEARKARLQNSRLGRFRCFQFWAPFTERGAYYHKDFQECGDNTYIRGFWQTQKYFCDIRSLLLFECTPREPFPASASELCTQVQESDSIALHIRRGDYVTTAAGAAVHGVCSMEYYKNAYESLRTNLKNPMVFVFSDDLAWARENLGLDATTVYVEPQNASSAYWDLCLMAKCKHYIIANSSFSWWGAWLGTFSAKRVCAPRKWFLDESQANVDLIPHEWIRI